MTVGKAIIPARQELKFNVRATVFDTVKKYPTVIDLQKKWPAATYQSKTQFQTLWKQQMVSVRTACFPRTKSWFTSWDKAWKKQPQITIKPEAPAKQPEFDLEPPGSRFPGAKPTDPKKPSGSGSGSTGYRKLTAADIRELRASGTKFLVHGTSHLQVATGEWDLRPATEQKDMSNSMQVVAVYAYVGVERSKGYGAYGVVIIPGPEWISRSDSDDGCGGVVVGSDPRSD